jgi:hypothetical protein
MKTSKHLNGNKTSPYLFLAEEWQRIGRGKVEAK